MNATPEMILAEFGPELRERQQARHAAERERLRQRLADLAPNVAKIRKLEDSLALADADVADMRTRLEAAEAEYAEIFGALSNARRKEADERAAVWRELEAVPALELAAFRQEIRERIESSGSLSRTWPSGRIDIGTGRRLSTGNRESVDAYVRALLDTRALIDNAIHDGLEGKDAEAAIAWMRAKWPKVQFGPSEWRTP